MSGCYRGYQPHSVWERDVYHQSNFKIHPDDVREKLKRYRKEQIAWVGIIQEVEFYDNPANYEIILLLEHRYFDWNLDVTDDPQIFYPSTRGEGLFQTTWFLKKSADLEYFSERFEPENLAMVYAVPDTVIDDIVLVKSRYIRIIDKNDYRADQLDYFPARKNFTPK
jgi:hypothetical protein